MPRRRQAGEMSHLTTSHQCKRALSRKAEYLLQPTPDNFLRDGRCRSRAVVVRILIPCGRQPIGTQRGRQRTANHPGKKASACNTVQAAIDGSRQFADYLLCWKPVPRKRLGNSSSQLRGVCRRAYRTFIQVRKVGHCLRRRHLQRPLKDRSAVAISNNVVARSHWPFSIVNARTARRGIYDKR